MSFEWTNGGPDAILRIVARERAKLREQVAEVVEVSALEGEFLMKDYLDFGDEAWTKTGQKRVDAGGESSGRHKTGDMIEAVESHTETDENVFIGKYGWRDPLDYFSKQEDGFGKIPAVHSIINSFAIVKLRFLHRVHEVAKNRWDGQ